jgi:hypothetical protein
MSVDTSACRVSSATSFSNETSPSESLEDMGVDGARAPAEKDFDLERPEKLARRNSVSTGLKNYSKWRLVSLTLIL